MALCSGEIGIGLLVYRIAPKVLLLALDKELNGTLLGRDIDKD